MQPKIYNFLFFAALLIIYSCGQQSNWAKKSELIAKKDTTIKYAKRFSIQTGENYKVVYLFGNKKNSDTTSVFVLCKNKIGFNNPVNGATIVQTPCNRIAALSSIYTTMLYQLGCLRNIIAIDNVDYYTNQAVIEKHKTQHLTELVRSPVLDLEKTIAIKPDIIFNFGMGDVERDVDKKLLQTKIPVAISLDHLEESPLARAEWIKFFAVFVGKEKEADSIFTSVEKNYTTLKKTAQLQSSIPSVFTELKYSEFWYMPGGKSYVAKLIADAGANFLWSDNPDFGSLPLSFEQVYSKAKDADYWINLSTVRTKAQLLSYEPRYKEFKAFKNGKLFNNTKTVNDKGYSNYWESGILFPDKILSDLILIFHPNLNANLKKELYYYEQIK